VSTTISHALIAVGATWAITGAIAFLWDLIDPRDPE
jgi:hypothetical protein